MNAYNGTSIELQKKIISIAGAAKTGNEQIDKITTMALSSWDQPALVYTYGLTCICMLKRQRDFLKTPLAHEFSSLVVERLAHLAAEDDLNVRRQLSWPVRDNYDGRLGWLPFR